MYGMQTQVNAQQAPAVAGDWCDGNPRAFVDAGQGALVAGDAGLIVGRFAWLSQAQLDNDNAPAIANNFGTGAPAGLLHRQQQGLIVTYLADASMQVQPGFEVALCSAGGLWVQNDGATAAVVGQKAYASFADGKVSFAATGAASTATSSAGSLAAGAGASATGVINGNIFTATGSLSGTFVAGGILSGTGVASGTAIVEQVTPLLAGEALGGLGRYVVSIPNQTVASTTISESWGVLTLGGTIAGTFNAGDPVSGPGGSSDPIPDGAYIVAQLTGTPGGAGTYLVNKTGTSTSAVVTAATNVETKWIAASAALPGELVKITSWPNG